MNVYESWTECDTVSLIVSVLCSKVFGAQTQKAYKMYNDLRPFISNSIKLFESWTQGQSSIRAFGRIEEFEKSNHELMDQFHKG